MFAFITLSNGVAVVQHAPAGHVDRVRTPRRGIGDAPAPEKADAAG